MIGNISKSKGFKGDPGTVGPQGPQGERGHQGDKGEKGDTPSVVFRYDKETGNLYCSSDGIMVDKDYVNSQKLVTKDDLLSLDIGNSKNADYLNYYGDVNLVPSDNNLFVFTTDDETMTASVRAADPYTIKGDIVIPYNYMVDNKVYTVTSFGEYNDEYNSSVGFEYCDRITSVVIPNTITVIPSMAFRGCIYLTSVKLPDTLTTIGDNAFQGCENLETIEIPESVTAIDYDAFTYCTKLNNVVLPDRIKVIPDGIFSGCSALSNVTFADDIIAIDGSAFYGTAIKTINIPESVTYIGQKAFARSDLTSITIPDAVTQIAEMAFYECASLTSVTIPAGVTIIDDWAFRDCEALTDVYFKGSKEQWDAITVGSNNDVLATATIHYNCANATKSDLYNASANAIRGTASGTAINISDVSPLEHYLHIEVSGVDNPTDVSIAVFGKNLWGKIKQYAWSNGITVTLADDGGYFLNGTATKQARFTVPLFTSGNGVLLENITMCANNEVENTGVTLTVQMSDGSFVTCVTCSDICASGTLSDVNTPCTALCVEIAKGTVLTNFKIKPQAEIGTILTGYEPYLGKIFTPNADGLVNYATSLSPATNILCDNESANVLVKYNKDLNYVLLEYSNKVAPSPASITIYADKWEQDANSLIWHQEVQVNNANITPYSKVDLQLSAEQVAIFYEKDLAFVTENDGGVVTVYCIGTLPQNTYTMQATVSEVAVGG